MTLKRVHSFQAQSHPAVLAIASMMHPVVLKNVYYVVVNELLRPFDAFFRLTACLCAVYRTRGRRSSSNIRNMLVIVFVLH